MRIEDSRPRHTIADIKAATAAAFDVPVVVLESPRRDRRAVDARWVAMWLAREFTGHSLPTIGRAFGDRDHTTVLHALREMPGLMTRRPDVGCAMVLAEAWLAGGRRT